MKNIEENIKKYYSSKKMSEDKISLLLDGDRSSRLGLPGYFKYAAAVIILLAVSIGYFQLNENELEKKVAKEIAMNHNKQLAVEYSSDNLSDLGNKLSKLDFKLASAASGIPGNYELLGGRYCSIQGNLAAQLKIKNVSTDKVETLYISELKGGLNKINPTDIDMDGVDITLWKKNGLLYGKASDI